MARDRNQPTARNRASGGRPTSGARTPSKPAPTPGRSGGKPKQPAKTNARPKSASAKPTGNPKVKRPQPTPTSYSSSPPRRRLERASAPVLLRLNAVPRWVPTAVMLLLLLAGLFSPSTIAAIFLSLVALFLAWLLALAWPTLPPPGRLARLMVIGLVLFSALVRLSGLHVGPRH
jgi:hypothetical protein